MKENLKRNGETDRVCVCESVALKSFVVMTIDRSLRNCSYLAFEMNRLKNNESFDEVS